MGAYGDDPLAILGIDTPEDPTGLEKKAKEEAARLAGVVSSGNAEDIMTAASYGAVAPALEDMGDEWGRLESNVNEEWARAEGNVSDEWARAEGNVSDEWARAEGNVSDEWNELEGNVNEAWGQLEEGWDKMSGDGGAGGGGGAGETTTTTRAPWEPIQGSIEDYYAQVGDWAKDTGPAPGATGETQQAWDLASKRALAGSPLTGMAQGAVAKGLTEENPALAMYGATARGDMMDQDFNKFFKRSSEGIGEQFRDVVLPSISSRFGGAGRAGSGAEKEMTERAMGQYGEMLGNIGTDIYGQERNRQMQAIGGLGSLWGQGAQSRMGYAGMAPSMAAADYADIDRLAGVGEQKRGYNQRSYDQPYINLERQSGLLSPALGFSETTSPEQKMYGNKDLNTASGIAGILNMFLG